MSKAKPLDEEQWLRSDSIYVLLRHLQQHVVITRQPGGRRLLRLFCCACCRMVRDRFSDAQWQAIEVSERYADGQARKEELEQAFTWLSRQAEQVRGIAYAASPRFAIGSAHIVARSVISHLPRADPMRQQAERRQADLLRDILGNPFRPLPAIDPGWLTWNGGVVVKLARSIADEHAFDRMPVLGDALEEAGCTAAEVLEHCRCGPEHARGCWLLDLLGGHEEKRRTRRR
jgi:hypothetical protein